MPSSKLSSRRATPKKPSVCISVTPLIVWSTTRATIRVLWKNTSEPPPAINIDQTVTVQQDELDPAKYTWEDPSATANQLRSLQLQAPLDPTYNAIIIEARDAYGTMHYSETYFEPAQSPPFTQQVTCSSYDYPTPGQIIAQITPSPA
jgi:hypothetical protein